MMDVLDGVNGHARRGEGAERVGRARVCRGGKMAGGRSPCTAAEPVMARSGATG